MTTPEHRIRKKISQILKELEESDENLNWWNLAHLTRDASAVAIATANNHAKHNKKMEKGVAGGLQPR
jgi:hypothetical protein